MGTLIITDTDFSFEWNGTENTTPPGSADIEDQPVLQNIQHYGEDFFYAISPLLKNTAPTAKLLIKLIKAFTIHHPAIKSYELVDTGIKEEGLSNLEDHISTVVTRKNFKLKATAIKVVTLANQEYTFPIN